MITFYDIPYKVSGNAWSPVNWKIRFVLNYKQLPYKTEWVEYTEIEPLCKKHGISPTGTRPDGSPYYTLPAIYDDKTGVYIADSIPIAQYLDKTYPETPMVVPAGTEALTYAFVDSFSVKLTPFAPSVFFKITEILNPVSAEHFKRSRASFMAGKSIEEVVPTGEALIQAINQLQSGLGDVHGWYGKNGGKKFIMGDNPTFSDFAVGALFLGVKVVFGEESGEWRLISSWHEGRWIKLVDDLKEYQAVL